MTGSDATGAATPSPGQNVRYSGFGVVLLGCMILGLGKPVAAMVVMAIGVAIIIAGFLMYRTLPLWQRLFFSAGTAAGMALIYLIKS